MLRLYGAPQGRLAAAVALFAPQWRAEAQWKSRGAETLLAVHADTPTGLKKAAQSLRSSFGADVYGAGDTSLAAAAVQALEAHDRLLACGDAAAGALLESRLEKVPGAEKVYDFGTMSYARGNRVGRGLCRAGKRPCAGAQHQKRLLAPHRLRRR